MTLLKANSVNLVISDLVLKPKLVLILTVLKVKFDCISYTLAKAGYIDLAVLYTRKYPMRRYILGVLTHTTALDRLWGGDETLTKWF